MLGSWILIAIATISVSGLAKDFNKWVTQVRSIESDATGDFKLTFDRTTADGKDQRIVLTDNDGIATLAVSQLLLVESIKNSKQPLSLDSKLTDVFREGEGRILTIQHDALQKLIQLLQSEVNAGQERAKITGTNLTILEALKLAKQLESRFSVKMAWTLRDIESMGAVIQKLSGGGGPYSAHYTQNSATKTFNDVLLNDQSNPSQSFLSGAVRDGVYLPSVDIDGTQPISKSHIWITGDVGQLAKRYVSPGAEPSSSRVTGSATHR